MCIPKNPTNKPHKILTSCSFFLENARKQETKVPSVHWYPDIFESATFSFPIQLPSTRIRRIRKQIRAVVILLSRVEKSKSPIACGRVNPDILKSHNVANSCPVSYQYGGTTATTEQLATTIARFMAHALNTFYCRGALGTWVNPDTIGCIWKNSI